MRKCVHDACGRHLPCSALKVALRCYVLYRSLHQNVLAAGERCRLLHYERNGLSGVSLMMHGGQTARCDFPMVKFAAHVHEDSFRVIGQRISVRCVSRPTRTFVLHTLS
jgi:hypothetical protein